MSSVQDHGKARKGRACLLPRGYSMELDPRMNKLVFTAWGVGGTS